MLYVCVSAQRPEKATVGVISAHCAKRGRMLTRDGGERLRVAGHIVSNSLGTHKGVVGEKVFRVSIRAEYELRCRDVAIFGLDAPSLFRLSDRGYRRPWKEPQMRVLGVDGELEQGSDELVGVHRASRAQMHRRGPADA